jgi:RHS repeat-associated protein
VALFKFKWNASTSAGFLVRWLSPGDYLALAISASDNKARLYKREADGALTTLATAGLGYALTSGTWYEGKIVIDDDPGNSALQQLRFWVDTDGDGDYSDEIASITTTAVDDVWSAGYVGLYRTGGSVLQQFDDVKVGYDNDADGDIADAGDDIQVLDSFDSSVMSLTYDDNGNLTDDGVLRYVYDGWNRLVKAQRCADGDTTTIGEYGYLPDNRRASKVVSHAGVEAVAGDGGNATVHYYYAGPSRDREGAAAGADPSRDGEGAVGGRWNIVEARNGSSQATRQWVWGTQYVDEPLLMDVTLDVASAAEGPRARDARRATPGTPRQGRAFEPGGSNTCDPDVTDATSIKDRRYYYHQDRQPLTRGRPRRGLGRFATAERSSAPRVKGNWNVVALLEADDTQGTAGRCVERFAYTPYGEFLVLKGESGSGNLGNALVASTVGNPFTHQGLPSDQEKGSYQNRHRSYAPMSARFTQRDRRAPNPGLMSRVALGAPRLQGEYTDGLSLYVYLRGCPTCRLDPEGLGCHPPSYFDPDGYGWFTDTPDGTCPSTNSWTEPNDDGAGRNCFPTGACCKIVGGLGVCCTCGQGPSCPGTEHQCECGCQYGGSCHTERKLKRVGGDQEFQFWNYCHCSVTSSTAYSCKKCCYLDGTGNCHAD